MFNVGINRFMWLQKTIVINNRYVEPLELRVEFFKTISLQLFSFEFYILYWLSESSLHYLLLNFSYHWDIKMVWINTLTTLKKKLLDLRRCHWNHKEKKMSLNEIEFSNNWYCKTNQHNHYHLASLLLDHCYLFFGIANNQHRSNKDLFH